MELYACTHSIIIISIIIIVGLNNKLLFADDASASASVAARKHF